jgi:hypothetical protein
VCVCVWVGGGGAWQCIGKLDLCMDFIRPFDSTLVCNDGVDTI